MSLTGQVRSQLPYLQYVQEEAGCKVLLAQKAYSLQTYPMISQYLSGTTASGLYEAKLAREEFQGKSMYLHRFQGCRLGGIAGNNGPYRLQLRETVV